MTTAPLTLTVGRVKIVTRVNGAQTSREVTGFICGPLALHPGVLASRYTITHMETGRAAMTSLTWEEAITALKWLRDLPWVAPLTKEEATVRRLEAHFKAGTEMEEVGDE